MLTKEITFENLDGDKVTQAFYFHLSKPELFELEFSKPEGFEAFFRSAVSNGDKAAIFATFKDFILRAYGVRHDDGIRFIKSKELSHEFSQTDAYSELFMELVTNAKTGSEFINSLMPKGLLEQAQKMEDARTTMEVVLPQETTQVPTFKMPETPSTNLLIGPKDPSEMSREELIEAFQKKQLRAGD